MLKKHNSDTTPMTSLIDANNVNSNIKRTNKSHTSLNNIAASTAKHSSTKLHTAKTHNRSLSYGKNLNKLSERPKVNRSKSSDGLLLKAKRNKSFTKLGGLQPLTKTMSNQSRILRERTVDEDDDDYEDVNAGDRGRSDDSDSEVSDIREETASGLEANEVIRQPLEEYASSHHSGIIIMSKSRAGSIQTGPAESDNNLQSSNSEKSASVPNVPELIASDANLNRHFPEMSNHLYGGSLLLSQSTGMERKIELKIDPNNSILNLTNYKYSENTTPESVGAVKPQTPAPSSFESSNSGISFKANKKPSSSNHNTPPSKPPLSSSNSSNNFNNYLKSGSSKVESRTQQRLWLQRENSLMDINGKNYFDSIQTRIEFERLSREFLNVRRYNNPTVESFRRLKTPNSSNPGSLSGTDNFESLSKIYNSDDINKKIHERWETASTVLQRDSHNHSHHQLNPVLNGGVLGGGVNGAPLSINTNMVSNNVTKLRDSNYMRSAVTPTTRAVKNQEFSNNKINLVGNIER